MTDLLTEMLSAASNTVETVTTPEAPVSPRLATMLDGIIAETVNAAPSAPLADPMLMGASAGLITRDSVKAGAVDVASAAVDAYLMPVQATPDVSNVVAAPAVKAPDPNVLAAINARLAARSAPARKVAPTVARSGYIQATVNFYKLSGNKGWGIRVPHGNTVRIGSYVAVTKKNGTRVWALVSHVLGTDKHGTVCTISAVDASRLPTCPGNNDCRRLGHRQGTNCAPL